MSTWTLSKFCRKPDGTYCIMMAQQWKMQRNLPFESAVDKAKARKEQPQPSTSSSKSRHGFTFR